MAIGRYLFAGVMGAGLALHPAPTSPREMAAGATAAGATAAGQEPTPAALVQMGSQQLIQTVIGHETDANQHRGYYVYLSVERSERTGGHEWTERVGETNWGKVHYLIAEDGKPLTGSRLAAERARIEDEGAHPDEFKKQEDARGQDEQHARQMLHLLPRAFLFDPPQMEGDAIRVHFRPNPDYSPASLEERVLHGMSGSVLIDDKMIRVRQLEGRLPQDVSIGFGFLATVKAGSNFATTRTHADGYDWKTETVHTDINGKALFLKTIARSEEARHSEFRKIPNGTTVADAVKMLEESR